MSSNGSNRPTLCSPHSAEAVAVLILGSYRGGEVQDAAIYVRATAAVLTGYSEKIVRKAFDPKNGLQTRQKWLPTVSEVRDACEGAAAELAAQERRAMLAKHRVLLDTPKGLRPESEVVPDALRLAGPVSSETEAERRQRAYDYGMRVKAELKAAGADPDPNKAPTGLTEDARRAWYAARIEANLAELAGRHAAQPVVIGEGLARKLAEMRAEPDAPTAQPPRFLDAAE